MDETMVKLERNLEDTIQRNQELNSKMQHELAKQQYYANQ